MQGEYYAHSLDGKPPKYWQPLEEHLKNVAEIARTFADAFGAGEWGYMAGLCKTVQKKTYLRRWFFMNEYQVAFEVAGPAAMFTRPDMGEYRQAARYRLGLLIKLHDR